MGGKKRRNSTLRRANKAQDIGETSVLERRRDPSLNEIRSVERVERAVMQIRIRDISRRIRRGEREEGWRAFDDGEGGRMMEKKKTKGEKKKSKSENPAARIFGRLPRAHYADNN